MTLSIDKNQPVLNCADTVQPTEEESVSRVDSTKESDHHTGIEVTTPLDGSPVHVPHGDSFFAEFLTADQHITLLKQRGLVFKNTFDEERFIRLIQTVGYYKLSQYFRHFYTRYDSRQFRQGIQGKHIVTAYKQNERLRSILIDALLKIECKLRTLVIEGMIQHTSDIYWCYDPVFASLEIIGKASQRNKQGRYTAQSSQLFVDNYPQHERFPAWVVMQSQEFGVLCQLIRHPKFPRKVLKALVKQLALPKQYDYRDIYSVFDALRHVRNLCVHHEKLLGEYIRISPSLWRGLSANYAHRLDNTLFWIEHLLMTVTLRDSFANEMQTIVSTVQSTCPSSMHITIYRPLLVTADEEAE